MRTSGVLVIWGLTVWISACNGEDKAPLGSAIDGSGVFCEGRLCNWQVEVGSVEPVPTWHDDAYGLELTGTPTIIKEEPGSIYFPETTGCTKYTLLADVEAEAEVSLEFDVFADDIVDDSVSIPGVHWDPLDLLVRLPPLPDGTAFRLRIDKKGPGRAVFATLSVPTTVPCNLPAAVLPPRGVGVTCDSAEDCATGVCNQNPDPSASYPPSSCGQCEMDADCAQGETCALADNGEGAQSVVSGGPRRTYRACIGNGSSGLGIRCLGDIECQSGKCGEAMGGIHATCTECVTDADCATGSTCALGVTKDVGYFGRCVDHPLLWQDETCAQDDECDSDLCCRGRCGQRFMFGCPF